jgi:hypothetical protein
VGTILYIARKQIKNNVIQLVRKPVRLIALIVAAALIIWMVWDLPSQSHGQMDLAILQSGFLAWLLVLGTITALSSVESGSSLFQLPDVNLLFVSPLSPKTVLAYGLARQTGKTVAGFAFLLFYSWMLVDNFGITVADVLLLILGSVLFLVAIQALALCLYCFANRGAVQRAAVKAGILAVPFLIILYVLYQSRDGLNFSVIYQTAASPVLDAFPVVGWIRGAVFALIVGNGALAGLYFALTAAFFALTILVLLKIDADYYEDVLSTAEKLFHVRRAIKEKRTVSLPTKKKVGRTGIGRGWGASAFFYKHLMENRRGSRFAWIGSSTLMLLLVNAAVAVVMRVIVSVNGHHAAADAVLFSGCGMSIYVMFFQNMMGDWAKELEKPYLYMVPEDPFRKLFWAGLSTGIQPAVNGLIVFAVMCAALHANPFTGIACVLGYASFGFLFTAGSVLGRRVLGRVPNRGIIMILYMLLLLLVLAPGVGGTLAVVLALDASIAGAAPLLWALPITIWNMTASLLIFYFCRGILFSCEK